MSLWEDLPVSVGANLISHWITKSELHQLDRACCSQGSREAYLSYCNNATSNNQVELHNESMVNWYLTRRIKFSAVNITEDIPVTSLNLIESIYKLLKLNASWIVEFIIDFNIPDHSLIIQIVNLCVNIKSLTISHESMHNDIITLLLQGLTKLTSDIFLNPTLCCCYELQDLEIMGSSLTISKFDNFLKYCHNMGSLMLDDEINKSTILQIADNCPNLTSLLLYENTEYNITDDDLLAILIKCRELTVLELSRCSELTNKSLSKISNFTGLRLEHCDNLTCAAAIQLVQRIPQLTFLCLSHCDRIGYKCILEILEIGKNLNTFVMYSIDEGIQTETTHSIMVEALKWRYPKLHFISIYV